jgi:hypothetical protein
MHHIHHFLDDLAGEILKVLRHHNFQQLGIGGLCLFGHLAQVLARVFGRFLNSAMDSWLAYSCSQRADSALARLSRSS